MKITCFNCGGDKYYLLSEAAPSQKCETCDGTGFLEQQTYYEKAIRTTAKTGRILMLKTFHENGNIRSIVCIKNDLPMWIRYFLPSGEEIPVHTFTTLPEKNSLNEVFTTVTAFPDGVGNPEKKPIRVAHFINHRWVSR